MRLGWERRAPAHAGAAMAVLEESRPFAQQLSNVYFTILSLFCFKLFVKISLAILSHFYIVKGNRKEAARIAAEFYGVTQGQGMFTVMCCVHVALNYGSSHDPRKRRMFSLRAASKGISADRPLRKTYVDFMAS